MCVWHHSLAARTHASHAWDRSSILRGATNKNKSQRKLALIFVCTTKVELDEHKSASKFEGEAHERERIVLKGNVNNKK